MSDTRMCTHALCCRSLDGDDPDDANVANVAAVVAVVDCVPHVRPSDERRTC